MIRHGGTIKVRIGERVRDVSIDRRGDGVTARVAGREYRLSVLEPQRGVYSILPQGEGGRSIEAIVSERDGVYSVRVRSRVFEASIETTGRPGAGRTSGAAGGRQVLKSVMPGRIVRVLVEPGAAVRRGQGIIVVEAMKMENELGSPGDGVVKEILAAAGDRVEAGATLAIIE